MFNCKYWIIPLWIDIENSQTIILFKKKKKKLHEIQKRILKKEKKKRKKSNLFLSLRGFEWEVTK